MSTKSKLWLGPQPKTESTNYPFSVEANLDHYAARADLPEGYRYGPLPIPNMLEAFMARDRGGARAARPAITAASRQLTLNAQNLAQPNPPRRPSLVAHCPHWRD